MSHGKCLMENGKWKMEKIVDLGIPYVHDKSKYNESACNRSVTIMVSSTDTDLFLEFCLCEHSNNG